MESKVEAVRISDCRMAATGIADAALQFYGDFKRLPCPPGHSDPAGDLDTDSSPESGFISLLAGSDMADRNVRRLNQHSRNINYLEGMKNARPGNQTDWISGFFAQAGTGACGFTDFMGAYYRVRLDTDYDGEIANPNPDEVREGRGKLDYRVIVWSAGKDGRWDTWDDNVKSW